MTPAVNQATTPVALPQTLAQLRSDGSASKPMEISKLPKKEMMLTRCEMTQKPDAQEEYKKPPITPIAATPTASQTPDVQMPLGDISIIEQKWETKKQKTPNVSCSTKKEK